MPGKPTWHPKKKPLVGSGAAGVQKNETAAGGLPPGKQRGPCMGSWTKAPALTCECSWPGGMYYAAHVADKTGPAWLKHASPPVSKEAITKAAMARHTWAHVAKAALQNESFTRASQATSSMTEKLMGAQACQYRRLYGLGRIF